MRTYKEIQAEIDVLEAEKLELIVAKARELNPLYDEYHEPLWDDDRSIIDKKYCRDRAEAILREESKT